MFQGATRLFGNLAGRVAEGIAPAFNAATRAMSRETLGGASSLSTAHQNLLQKQQEHQGLVALRDASAELLEQIEKLAGMGNIMADGGEGASS